MEKQALAYSDNDQVPNKGVEPILVVLLNFLFLGLGHIALGQTSKGIAYIVLNFVWAIAIVLLSIVFIGFCLIPVAIIWWIKVLMDGYEIAERIKQGKVVKMGECSNFFAKLGVSFFERSEVFVQ